MHKKYNHKILLHFEVLKYSIHESRISMKKVLGFPQGTFAATSAVASAQRRGKTAAKNADDE